jgi:tRNA nucleotidyltransferase (CCA-adding enzyme)
VVTFIMKESIKFKNSDVQAMSTILRNVDSMMELLLIYANDTSVTVRDRETKKDDMRLQIGTILFDAKELWVTILMLAIIVLLQGKNENEVHLMDAANNANPSNNTNLAHSEHHEWLQLCNAIYHDILCKYELDNCWSTIRPLMNGQELIRELNLPKGPAVGLYMEEQMKYLIRCPTSSKQQCLQYLQELDHSTFSLSLDLKASNKKKKT